MLTLKLKYNASEEIKSLILKYQRQYSSCLHFMYNRICDSNGSISEINLRKLTSSIKNIELLDSYLVQCSIKEAQQLYNSRKAVGEDPVKLIFGGKKNYFGRMPRKKSKNPNRSTNKFDISREDFLIKKLNPINSIGEASKIGNRKFRIQSDIETIVFQPNRHDHFELKLVGIGNRLQTLKQLYLRQQNKSLSISYKLDTECIYISFDEDKLNEDKLQYSKVQNRVLGIDLNPNYIGWTIVDWKSENEFEIIKSGVYSFKKLIDKRFEFNKLGLIAEDPKRIWLANKLKHESIEVAKAIFNKAVYYKCSIISIEDLCFDTRKEDKNTKGKNYNALCKNHWLTSIFREQLIKRCNIFGIKLLKVKPEFSSFVGNFLFRHLNLPDMCLAAFELSRRAYEFNSQYVEHTKDIKKNIVQPDIQLYKGFYTKSLEEFGFEDIYKDLVELYYKEKMSKLMYRLSLSKFDLEFWRFSTHSSKLSQYDFYS